MKSNLEKFITNSSNGSFLKTIFFGKKVSSKGKFTLEIKEEFDSYLMDMERLDLVKCDWEEMRKQTHKGWGDRRISCEFSCEKLFEMLGRVDGKKCRVSHSIIKKLGSDCENQLSIQSLLTIFNKYNVPESMIDYTSTGNVSYILTFYASSKNDDDFKTFTRIVSDLLNELCVLDDSSDSLLFNSYHRSFDVDSKASQNDKLLLTSSVFTEEKLKQLDKHRATSDTTKSNKIFYIKSDELYHYKRGKMTYSLRSNKIPQYLITFMTIVEYFPDGKSSMSLKQFEKLLPKEKRLKNVNVYHGRVGTAGKSFHSFLKENGVENIHPARKNKILKCTSSNYLAFDNSL